MATVTSFRYISALSLLILFIKSVSADQNWSFAFKNFGNDSSFESKIALYGDAKVVNGGSSLEISGFSRLSAGRVFYKKPIKLFEENPKRTVSFSTNFTFSISPENGDGLAFVMVPVGFPSNVFDGGSFGLLSGNKNRIFGVEFDTWMDDKYGDLNGNHVGVDVNSLVSVKVGNVSSINLVLNSGKKLQAWIDYEAGSKRLEVRLSKLGEARPVDPLLLCPIDLSHIWKEEEVFVGLSSSSGNSSQRCNVYSWSFKLRLVPHWMHSQPLDPDSFSKKTKSPPAPNTRDCLLKVLAAMIFGTGIGALGAFFVLFVWTVFGNRRPVVPEEYSPRPVGFEYENFKVVVDKATKDGKN
ncbi:concanavalin A-like lectin family protein [Actinidia rufa]|uniref:Concanavalin A-like lectin family protein n=1 Tax=Actinidia rufa TaxID=165716 RepID=A0A7J0EB80_9ERIC|nr:concanavalin A-like lectin family protein [Actinidia rufa]